MKLLTVAAMLALSFTSYAADYSFNSSESKLEWEGKKVSGAHQGTVALKSGNVSIEKGTLKGGEVVVDLSKLTITDLQGEWADKLSGHLKSDDFFSVEKYPEVTFKIDSVKKLKGNKYEVTGPLSIKGKTAKQSFTVDVKEVGDKVTVAGDIAIDRTTYDIRYGSGKFFDPKTLGDKMIDDKFTLKLNLVATK
jgi:polyisoprenoid-binding protein YceI